MAAQPVCPLCGHKVAPKERHVTEIVLHTGTRKVVRHVAGKCKPSEPDLIGNDAFRI